MTYVSGIVTVTSSPDDILTSHCCTYYIIIIIIIIIIINEFNRKASLTKTSGPLCVTCCTSVNGTVAGVVRCRMIYGTVPSSVHA